MDRVRVPGRSPTLRRNKGSTTYPGPAADQDEIARVAATGAHARAER
jgi:hypothetical protein